MKAVSDVAVVGAGPCGSFAAFDLARRGVSVIVFEEHPEIGIPCHCAGHLTIKGLQSLGLYPLPTPIVENTFRGAFFHSPSGKKFSVRFPSLVTCTVDRVLFDKYIAKMAEKAGASYSLSSRVNSVASNSAGRNVSVFREGKTLNVLSKLVIDAEGLSSRILRQAGMATPDQKFIVNAVETEIEKAEDTEPDMVEVFLSKAYAPGLYAWLIPIHAGIAKVGLASRNGNPKRLLLDFMHHHPSASKKLSKARILRMSFYPIALGGMIPRVFSDRLLVVGDAASQVKPTTGGGVVLGMTCARIAADIADTYLREDCCPEEILALYQKRCTETLNFDMRAMLAARLLLNRMSDKKIDDAFNFISKLGLETILERFHDLDFQGRSLLRLIRNPAMFPAILYFVYLYLSANA